MKKKYFRDGESEEKLKKYQIIGENNDQRIKNIEEKVNDINLTLKKANSIPSIARNAFINYIVMYLLLAIIIIFHIAIIFKPACKKMEADNVVKKPFNLDVVNNLKKNYKIH
jgi:t-SNARE complex subunit (syntaxin)